jgi:hypothetical protein
VDVVGGQGGKFFVFFSVGVGSADVSFPWIHYLPFILVGFINVWMVGFEAARDFFFTFYLLEYSTQLVWFFRRGLRA